MGVRVPLLAPFLSTTTVARCWQPTALGRPTGTRSANARCGLKRDRHPSSTVETPGASSGNHRSAPPCFLRARYPQSESEKRPRTEQPLETEILIGEALAASTTEAHTRGCRSQPYASRPVLRETQGQPGPSPKDRPARGSKCARNRPHDKRFPSLQNCASCGRNRSTGWRHPKSSSPRGKKILCLAERLRSASRSGRLWQDLLPLVPLQGSQRN